LAIGQEGSVRNQNRFLPLLSLVCNVPKVAMQKWREYIKLSTVDLICVNPNPHGHGRICPHYFQRPITRKVLKCKKLAKIIYFTKTSAESKSWVMYTYKMLVYASFMPQGRPMPEKCGLAV
jgi:hypothetical protein